jgi:hypothetical protein
VVIDTVIGAGGGEVEMVDAAQVVALVLAVLGGVGRGLHGVGAGHHGRQRGSAAVRRMQHCCCCVGDDGSELCRLLLCLRRVEFGCVTESCGAHDSDWVCEIGVRPCRRLVFYKAHRQITA